MGTIKSDASLDKLRAIAGREVRGCVVCGQTEGAPNHGEGKGRHAYVDPADEPIFVLRAQDATAHRALITWLEVNRETAPSEKFDEAVGLLAKMLKWPKRKAAD